MWRFRFICLVLALGLFLVGQAQTIVSPYSNNGLGELVSQGMPNHIGMGGIGIGTPTYWQINSINPALLVNNALTTFNVGFQGDLRNFRSTNTTGSDGTAGLRLLNISFPIIPAKWTSNVALLPYSTVNYDFFNDQPIDGTDVTSRNRFTGEGGLTRLDWSNGIRLRNNLAIGIKASYLFGSIRNSSETIVEGDVSPFSVVYSNDVSYNDFIVQFGGYYRHNLTEKKALNFGVIYTPTATLEGVRDEMFIRRADALPIQTSDIELGQQADFDLPQALGFGISYQDINKFLVGVDVELNTGGEFSENTTLFRRRLRISAGGELIPDYTNVRSYFSRASYRLGFTYEQVPYIVNDRELEDFSLSVGTSLPINTVSTVDMAFRYGFRGTTQNNLVQENYVQVVLGVTINERWFIKRRYD